MLVFNVSLIWKKAFVFMIHDGTRATEMTIVIIMLVFSL